MPRRNPLYTAVTRAKRMVVLVGSKWAIGRAVWTEGAGRRWRSGRGGARAQASPQRKATIRMAGQGEIGNVQWPQPGDCPGGACAMLGRCPDAIFVAVGVGELGPFAPGFRAQLSGQSDPTTFERFTGCVNVVRVQDIAGPAGFVAPIWPRRPSMMWVCAPGGATSSQRSVSLMG